MSLSVAERMTLRRWLREARSRLQADSEDFHDLLAAIERVGAYAHDRVFPAAPPGKNMFDYRAALRLIAQDAAVEPRRRMTFDQVFERAKDARNDALHQGAVARGLARSALDVAMVLEDGLLQGCQMISHYMTEEVATVAGWHPIDNVRRAMLVNSFSWLPYRVNKKWWLVSDHAVASYLSGKSKTEKRKLLRQQLRRAVEGGLRLQEAQVALRDEGIGDVWQRLGSGQPCLVVPNAKSGRLLGIVTAFDLL